MDVISFLREVCAMPGHPGMERPVAARIAEEFGRYSTDVTVSPLGNVTAVMGPAGAPKVLICAHMDEIGLIVTGFDERGGLTFAGMGGVDPRILPGMEVIVHAKEPVYGVIGVKPPHLAPGGNKAPAMKDLSIDSGFSKEEIEKRVKVGDPISFKAPLIELANGRIASKTLDDRACVASMIVAMELLSRVQLNCRALFCATMAEEIGAHGAKTEAYRQRPDMAIAIDVTHGPTPGVDRSETNSLEAVTIVDGPVLHPAMAGRLRETAKKLNITVEQEIASRLTYTDGDNLQVANEGIPTGLLSVPLSYMHTTVETVAVRTVEETGRLLAGFLLGVDAGWEEWLCFKDC